MAKTYLMQARDSSSGALTTWLSQNRDFAGADYPGPGTPTDPTVLRAAGSDGGGTGLAGIGTIASPGTLRGIIGASSDTAYHVGGFWSLADSGGGAFFWDAASTEADDQGTIIRPSAAGIGVSDPGRWKRIYHGPLHVDWFGAKGDATTADTDDGTDDSAAIQAAINWCKQHAHRLVFNPKKVYRWDLGEMDLTEAHGVVLDGLGGFRYTTGARIKFTGAHNDALIKVFSANGVQIRGLTIDVTRVTRAATDLTYANSAARLADTLTSGDLGKTATDTDTGLRWRLYAAPNSWFADKLSVIDIRHKNWNGIGGAEGGDTNGFKLIDCLIAGRNDGSFVCTEGVTLAKSINNLIDGCTFIYLGKGIVGSDPTVYGWGYSNVTTVARCSFKNNQTKGIYDPFQSWKIDNCDFENLYGGAADGVTVAHSGCVGLEIVNNWSGDSVGGIAFDLFGVHGCVLRNNYVYVTTGGATFCKLASVSGLSAGGNTIYTQYGYTIVGTGGACYALDIGGDYLGSPTMANYFSGTNYANACIRAADTSGTVGGLRVGDQNTLTGVDAMAVGRSNTSAGFSAAIGVSNTAPAGGLTSGQSGVGHTNSERCLGGGSKLGVGGAQGCDIVSCNQILTGATTSLLNASQAAPCFTISTSRMYRFRSEIVIGNIGSSWRVGLTIKGLVQRTGAGVTTIVSQSTVETDDPDVTGITAQYVLNGNNIDISVTNPTAGTVNATAYTSWVEGTG